jgi:hypothetical protein
VALILLHYLDLFWRELLNYIAPIEQRSFVKYNYNGTCWDLSWIGVRVGARGGPYFITLFRLILEGIAKLHSINRTARFCELKLQWKMLGSALDRCK